MGDERRDDLVDEDKSEEGEEDGVLEAKDNTKTEVDDDLHQEVRAWHQVKETAPRTQVTRLIGLVWNWKDYFENCGKKKKDTTNRACWGGATTYIA